MLSGMAKFFDRLTPGEAVIFYALLCAAGWTALLTIIF